jgi:pimeloyl-ACP methyl ester carboxylesterase
MTPELLSPGPPCDFGGEGPVLHLAHANGFPPRTYRLLAEILTARYHVIGLPSRPLWPGSRPESVPHWRVMADDLIRGLDDLGLQGIVGVGHSMGGDLTLWAAISRPDLFRAAVLVDPVILPPMWLRGVQLLRCLGLGRKLPLAEGALRRRRLWPNRQVCYERYRRLPVFAHWPDASLRAYVEAGTRERSDGQVELAYPPEWEAHIFATVPTDIWRAVPRLRPDGDRPSPPTLVMRGERSDTFRAASQARMERLLPQARYLVIPDAGHLLPMERPAEVGAAILDFLEGV